jgi:hypothetical protein
MEAARRDLVALLRDPSPFIAENALMAGPFTRGCSCVTRSHPRSHLVSFTPSCFTPPPTHSRGDDVRTRGLRVTHVAQHEVRVSHMVQG